MKPKEHITPIDQHIIDFVRGLRNKKGLTQQDIASILGISRSYVKDIEDVKRRGKYNLIHVNALADYFNLSPKDFLPEKALPLAFPGMEVDEEKKQRKSAGRKGKVKKVVKGAKRKTPKK